MANPGTQRSADWAGNARTYGLVWGLPIVAILGGLLLDIQARAVVWAFALAWMGTACILNARRCGRTHCRYTGPYYLLMIGPTLFLSFGAQSVGVLGWSIFAGVILLGSKLLWWVTERSWGAYSS